MRRYVNSQKEVVSGSAVYRPEPPLLNKGDVSAIWIASGWPPFPVAMWSVAKSLIASHCFVFTLTQQRCSS
jgi:hypothetical protein